MRASPGKRGVHGPARNVAGRPQGEVARLVLKPLRSDESNVSRLGTAGSTMTARARPSGRRLLRSDRSHQR